MIRRSNIIKKAIENKQYDFLIKVENINEALRYAASYGYLEMVKYLCGGVSHGSLPDIHANNDAALRWAVERGHLDIVKYLITAGADVHADNDYSLRWAVERGHLEMVKCLVEAGADIHVYDDYALRYAVWYNHLDIVKILIKAGADIHAACDLALGWAAANNNLNIVKILISEVNFHTYNKEIIYLIIENNKNISKEIKKYLKYLPIQILYMRISACCKIQKWFRHYLIKKYSPDSNYVKNDIKPRFESMQI